ncbi:MAG TPA: YIP1 family protein, partial [Gemmatimonadaceae bacterium]
SLTPEQLAKARDVGLTVTRYSITVIMLATMFVLGIVSWIVGKLVGSQQTLHAALVVAGWAYMPRVIGAVLGGVQGLLMDPSKLTSQLALSIGPARFFDAEATNPLLYQFLGRFDLITIWVTILLAIGLYVTGKVSKPKAAIFGVLIWFVGSLPMLRQGFLAM